MTSASARRPPARPYKPRDAAVTSRMMAAVRGKNSRAELALRRALWRRGFRYRLHDSRLVGRPDIVLAKWRAAVFVDSDYWHARLLIEQGEAALRATIRGARQDWWVAKLTRNAERDREVTTRLSADGWRVIRVWESDILVNPERVADIVERALKGRVLRERRCNSGHTHASRA